MPAYHARDISFHHQPPDRVRWGLCAFRDVPLLAGLVDDGAICRLSFRNGQAARTVLSAWQRSWPRTVWVEDGGAVAHLMSQALAGKGDGRLLMIGTTFQQAVWQQLARLAPGQTISYAELAGRVDKPRAARAVGTACGANPVPILVPCHRVLASDGGLGGFAGGLAVKRALLAAEGVALDAELPKHHSAKNPRR